MGLLTSKSRIANRNTSIARLKLISGHMGANLVKKLCQALNNMPIASITVWMDSTVAMYWITNPGKVWKTFESNRVQNRSQITEENTVNWIHCPSEKNVADLGSRGASIQKLEKGN